MKVADTAKVKKNSAVLTVPTVLRGSVPCNNRFDVTTGPQPPPPEASRNPPIRPKGTVTLASFTFGMVG